MNLTEILTSVDELLETINQDTNILIKKECTIIDIKLEEIKNKQYKSQAGVNGFVDGIISNDIRIMKSIPGRDESLYTNIELLAEKISLIKEYYFAE